MTNSAVFSNMKIPDSLLLAEPLARKAVSLDPNEPDVHVRLGMTMFLSGDLRGAIEQAERALELYVDGSLVARRTEGTPLVSRDLGSGTLVLGGGPRGGFDGELADVRLHGRALGAAFSGAAGLFCRYHWACAARIVPRLIDP